jgi:hypothetical protein
LKDGGVVREDDRDVVLVKLAVDKVIAERIREGMRVGEGGKDDVSELGAMGRNCVDEGVIVLGKEVGEVVEEGEEDAHRSLEEHARGVRHLGRVEEGGEELEEGNEKIVIFGPALKTAKAAEDNQIESVSEKGKSRKRRTFSLSA